jgi:hypothetical protein
MMLEMQLGVHQMCSDNQHDLDSSTDRQHSTAYDRKITTQ